MYGREKDEVKLNDLPSSASKYEKWKDKAHSKIIAASGRPLKCKSRLNENVLAKDLSEVADIRDDWQTFDTKLTSALLDRVDGLLEQQIMLDRELSKVVRPIMSARAIMWRAQDWYRLSAQELGVDTRQQLYAVEFKSDAGMLSFMNKWTRACMKVDSVIKVEDRLSEQEKHTLFYRQVSKSRDLEHDLAIYDRAEMGSENKSYKFLPVP